MNFEKIMEELKKSSDKNVLKGMEKYKINIHKSYGIPLPKLRKIAKEIGINHHTAKQLWLEAARETRILATMLADPSKTTNTLMEEWVLDFNSWEICDQCCMNLFRKIDIAWEKAIEWTSRKEEFVKRAGFTLIATLTVHDLKASDDHFIKLFKYINKESTDSRNFVKKAVNWALREIGKRTTFLNQEALKAAQIIRGIDSKSAKWIANDAIRELTGETALHRIRAKERMIQKFKLKSKD